jgi:alcohol dehydrogenase
VSFPAVSGLVFAAGAGPGSGSARKETMDYGGAVKLIEAAKMNQAPVKRQWPRLFSHIRNGYLKPSDIVTHRIPLEHIADGYHIFSAKLDNCIKPLIIPNAA